MTCETCKYANDERVQCSFNRLNNLAEIELIQNELEQTIFYKISPEFLQPLNDKIDNLVEWLHETYTDESIAGCLGKYPSNVSGLYAANRLIKQFVD